MPVNTDRQRRYWRSNMRLTWLLVVLWAVPTFVVPFFARDLDFVFFGWPFSFWVASQGALIAYLAISWIYARRMNRLDEEQAGRSGQE
ncbi:DUF4212 domain-containing protein [Pelomonas sp. SE-A7]|uniref:DUF4212 domain-containing protein n=1 Tax=Pelomonas sp. SE-A7 TaxID=3054953 RepID=UPI00259CA1F4|nr:DUF4212 domain-containing protein [Pelomonas sp. SE-A7]MDM4767269.1 DUF4212 domain-containing protein [Pelomonas sp. SE-A7]